MWLGISVTLLFFNSSLSYCQYQKNDLKAAYIENITRFIDWPVGNQEKGKTKFVFGIYEDQEFFDRLIDIFAKRKIKDTDVEIVEIKSPDQIQKCNLIYIGDIRKTDLEKLLPGIISNGILSFSESESLRTSGIHFNFYLESGKLRFEANMKSLEKGGFRVSSLLLNSCKIIDR